MSILLFCIILESICLVLLFYLIGIVTYVYARLLIQVEGGIFRLIHYWIDIGY